MGRIGRSIPASGSNTLGKNWAAYVNVAGLARNREDFIGKLSLACESLDLNLVECEEIDIESEYIYRHGLGEEIRKITRRASMRNKVAFGMFYTYDYDDA